MDDLSHRVELAGGLIQELQEALPPGTWQAFEREHRDISRRLGYLGEEVLIALVGGTGSGKSSLLNAIAGEVVSPPGVIRPTTSHPLAWIPHRADPELLHLLTELDIDDRVMHDDEPWMVVIDLPDIDSVEAGNRQIVEDLLPRADVVAWVTDPEKYGDRVMFREFIAPLARYQEQFVFILNQVDRLSAADRPVVVDHFGSRLREVGIEATVIPVAAAPVEGPPLGLAALREHLGSRFVAKEIVRRKLALDLDGLVARIREYLGGTRTAITPWEGLAPAFVSEAEHLLAPPGLDAEFEKAGRITATGSAGGPIGRLLGLLRRGGVALGVSQATTGLEEATSRWRERQGRTELETSVMSAFMDAAQQAGPILGTGLRLEARGVPDGLDAAIDSARRETTPRLDVSPRPWWRVLAVLAWLAALAVVGSAAWAWLDPGAVRPGEGLDPVLLGAGSLALGLVTRWLTLQAGRRAGRRTGREYRLALRGSLRRHLDRRLGESYEQQARASTATWEMLDGVSRPTPNFPSPSI